MSRRRRAFTLVELLVVIGIIAVVVAMLMTTISRAWAAAKLLQCSTNLRAMAQAANAYATDYKGRAPRELEEGRGHDWATQIGPYLGKPIPAHLHDIDLGDDPAIWAWDYFATVPVFQCPTSPRFLPMHYTINSVDFDWYRRHGVYLPPRRGRGYYDLASYPSDAAYLMEQAHDVSRFGAGTTYGVFHPGQMTYNLGGQPNLLANMIRHTDRHHGDKSPFAFIDGRVETRRISPHEISVRLLNPYHKFETVPGGG